ncbi:MAG: VacJ family lipoprotein [Lamprocystis purpurea]|jgi:phospholipid-binding lipoprotein MlaA|uniref:MlaA family lipoprotein n=1 Tax=Lamprocystis purpurea TaxID=61598 RepID=UPI00068427E9|nr:VacJ family lipoprotein [Lamprocystis purpurea]MBV5273628.1 VacJ family lipoprotein [Lamprocystis purpurea]
MYSWKSTPRTRRLVGLVLPALLVAACASNPDRVTDPRDPLEPFNRAVFRFNTDFDNAFMRPLAKGYKAVTPEPVDRGITNFFSNIDDFTSFVNNILQFKMSRAGSDLGRIFMNSTVGILGFFDVATNAGLPSYKEDFGQTLGYWGIPPGAYFMLPIFGPSNLRDNIGFAGDIVTDPFFSIETGKIYWGFATLRIVDFRADRLAAGEILTDAALDPYVFLRDAYLQRRRNLVYDGNPPESEDQADIWADVDFKDSDGSAPVVKPAPPPTRTRTETFGQ